MTAGTNSKTTLTVYSRKGCHLCDEMLFMLRKWQPQYGFDISVEDVDTNADWKQKHGLRVPVLMHGEQELCWGRLDDNVVLGYLDSLAS